MKRFFVPVMFAALAVAFVACDENGGNDNGENGNENGTTVNTVSGKITNKPADDKQYELKLMYSADNVFASTTVADDGSFSFELPETVDTDILALASEIIADDRIALSNENIRITGFGDLYWEVWLDGSYTGNDVNFDKYDNATETGVTGNLIYADGNGTATGTYNTVNETYIYDLDVKKGWNWMYVIEQLEGGHVTVTYTTDAQTGLQYRVPLD
jgi:hypothetical protein